MPRIIVEPELRQFVSDNTVIKNGEEKSAEGVKYDFRLGERFVKFPYNDVVAYDELRKMNTQEKQATDLQPGEVVYVMTEETLDLPMDIKIDLHEKRKMGHERILVLVVYNI